MKVGDLVQFNDSTAIHNCGLVGLIIETGHWVGRHNVKVMWCGADTRNEQSRFLELVYESR
jgi:hypothetical protein